MNGSADESAAKLSLLEQTLIGPKAGDEQLRQLVEERLRHASTCFGIPIRRLPRMPRDEVYIVGDQNLGLIRGVGTAGNEPQYEVVVKPEE